MKQSSRPSYVRIFVFSGLIVCVLLLIGGILLQQGVFDRPASSQPTACTEEAKLCADGSYVGRSGPKCEFAPCPADETESWQDVRDEKQSIEYRYPAQLATTYIHPQDWPPIVTLAEGNISCAAPFVTMNGRSYCRTIETEGAAGSVYTTYTYSRALESENKTVAINFTLRTVQCANYDDPQKTACEKEQQTFVVDALADKISSSIQIIK